MFLDVCFVLFLFHLIACNAFAFKSMVYCGSAFEPGASGLPYYCTPPVCVPAVIATGRASCVVTNNFSKKWSDVYFLPWDYLF